MSTVELEAINGFGAWGRLLDTFFTEEDRAKVEWSIGAVFASGPKKILVLTGHSMSGKSTVLQLAKQVLTFFWTSQPRLPVAFRHDGLKAEEVREDSFMFVASNTVPRSGLMNRVTTRTIVAPTTGYQLPSRTYHMLAGMVISDVEAIARHCVSIYDQLGENYYDHPQENAR